MLVDPTRALLLEQVLALPGDRFLSVRDTPQPDHHNAYWIRVTLRNALDRDEEFFLSIDWWDHLLVHLVRQGGRREQLHASGLLDPMIPADPLSGRSLRLQRGESVTLYLRAERGLSFWRDPDLVPTLLQRSAFLDRQRADLFFTGAFFGILFGIACYHALLYLQVRDRAYLWYALYLGALGFSLVGQMGEVPSYLSQFFVPESPLVGFIIKRVSDLVAWTSLALFGSRFLELPSFAPRLRWLIPAFLVLLLVQWLLWSAFGISPAKSAPELALAFALMSLAIWRWRCGFKPARLFAVGLFLLLFGTILMEMRYNFQIDLLSFLPPGGIGGLLRFNQLWIAAAIYAILFGLALGERYRTLQDALETERDARQKLFQAQAAALEIEVTKRTLELHAEKARSDELLSNILPDKIARELRENGSSIPQRFDEVTVVFTDFKGFTNAVATLPPRKVVEELNDIFRHFDDIIAAHGVEKIKTVGDSYMIAGGVPVAVPDHAQRCAAMLFAMFDYIEERNRASPIKWDMRAGMHSGAVVAGVVGKHKFTYDIWGDTVNIASRMESASEPGRINVSAYTYSLLQSHFKGVYRGKLDAKGKGEVDMYFLERIPAANVPG